MMEDPRIPVTFQVTHPRTLAHELSLPNTHDYKLPGLVPWEDNNFIIVGNRPHPLFFVGLLGLNCRTSFETTDGSLSHTTWRTTVQSYNRAVVKALFTTYTHTHISWYTWSVKDDIPITNLILHLINRLCACVICTHWYWTTGHHITLVAMPAWESVLL